MLLVRDDDQLRGLLEILEHLEQAQQVALIKRRLDLVHDIERRRTRLENRDQHRKSGKRSFTTGQQRKSLDLLSCRPRFNLDAGRQHVRRVGERELALTTREQTTEDRRELFSGISKRISEDRLHVLIHFVDELQQLGAGVRQVLDLPHQILMPFLKRRELFQSQRIDLAQSLKVALCLFQTLELNLTVERLAIHRVAVLIHLLPQLGPRVRRVGEIRRHRKMRAKVLNEVVRGHRNLRQRLFFKRLVPRLTFGLIDLGLVRFIPQLGQPSLRLRKRAACCLKLRVTATHRFLSFLNAHLRSLNGTSQETLCSPHSLSHRLSFLSLGRTPRRPTLRFLSCCTLSPCRTAL